MAENVTRTVSGPLDVPLYRLCGRPVDGEATNQYCITSDFQLEVDPAGGPSRMMPDGCPFEEMGRCSITSGKLTLLHEVVVGAGLDENRASPPNKAEVLSAGEPRPRRPRRRATRP